MSKYLTYFPLKMRGNFSNEELTLLAVMIAQSQPYKDEYRCKRPLLPYSSIGTSKSYCKMWSKHINRLEQKGVIRWEKSTVYIKAADVPFMMHSNEKIAEAKDNISFDVENLCCYWTNKYAFETINERYFPDSDNADA